MHDMTSTDAPAGQRRHRKVAALLAGGLVVFIGAMATLASWNDSEFASATFTSGRFALEGSLDNGSTYAEHNPSPGALTFTAPVSNLSPGDIVNAGFPVRLAAGTTNNASLRIGTIGIGGGYTGLSMIVWQNTTSNDCSATYTPSTNMGFLDGATFYAGPWTPTLTKGATVAVAGAPVYVCFKMIAGSTLPQNQVTNESWTLTATSQ
jgi:predicted ribosomally synthesized peptide with SipW-like signal peptide